MRITFLMMYWPSRGGAYGHRAGLGHRTGPPGRRAAESVVRRDLDAGHVVLRHDVPVAGRRATLSVWVGVHALGRGEAAGPEARGRQRHVIARNGWLAGEG